MEIRAEVESVTADEFVGSVTLHMRPSDARTLVPGCQYYIVEISDLLDERGHSRLAASAQGRQ